MFARVHPKFKTPWINTILVGLLAMGFAGFMSLDSLANLTNVGTLAAFAEAPTAMPAMSRVDSNSSRISPARIVLPPVRMTACIT